MQLSELTLRLCKLESETEHQHQANKSLTQQLLSQNEKLTQLTADLETCQADLKLSQSLNETKFATFDASHQSQAEAQKKLQQIEISVNHLSSLDCLKQLADLTKAGEGKLLKGICQNVLVETNTVHIEPMRRDMRQVVNMMKSDFISSDSQKRYYNKVDD